MVGFFACPKTEAPWWLVEHGFAMASIEARLRSEAVAPAAIRDCKAAVRWLRANAAKYRIDPDQIGVVGFSAGGHRASMLGVTGPEISSGKM